MENDTESFDDLMNTQPQQAANLDEGNLLQPPEVDVSKSKSFFQKYGSAMKTFIPIRPFSHDVSKHPNDTAGFFSTLTFSWITALVLKVFRSPPTSEDLWELSPYDQAQLNYERLAELWENEVRVHGLKNVSMWRVMLRFVRTRLIVGCICTFLFSAAVFASSSIILRQLLLFTSQGFQSPNDGYVLLGILLTTEVCRAVSMTALFAVNYRTAVRTRASVLMLVFKKVLKLPSGSGTDVGELVTICSNDGDRIFEANRMGSIVILGPIVFIAGTVYVTYLLGPTGLIGSGIFIGVLPLQAVLVRIMNNLRFKAIKLTESRVKKINEIFSSIKLIKMYSWESSFAEVVEAIRKKELNILKSSAFLNSINVSTAFLTPVFASVLLIISYVALGNNLIPEDAFTAIAIFNSMSYALKMMPIAIKYLADVNPSIQRFKNILLMDSLEEYIQTSTKDEGNAIEMVNAVLSWKKSPRFAENAELTQEEESVKKVEDEASLVAKEEHQHSFSAIPPVLKDVNITIRKGSLVGICGAVGAGKSSFISSLMGHLQLLDGSVSVNGSVAYAPQEAWLMNATIRENILFGLPFVADKYQEVIKCCELETDFNILITGDLTEVGERGINLSGGQKQRISLARALYSSRDIYLLDDPLSAVDAHVGKHIFKEAIISYLKNNFKTVILVTHQVQYLPQCDQVLIVESGCIQESSEYNSVVQICVDAKASSQHVIDNEITQIDQLCASGLLSHKVLDSSDEEERLSKGKLMTDEERGEIIPLSTYWTFLKAAGGPYIGLLMFLFFCLNVAIQQFSNFWLSYWLSQGSGQNTTSTLSSLNYTLIVPNTTLQSNTYSTSEADNILINPKFHFYLMIYGLSAVSMFLISIFRGYAYVCMSIRISHTLHLSLFNRILHGTMTFFDTTPVGRIINRFQKDMDEQDSALPVVLELFLFNFVTLLFATGLIAFVFPKFFIAICVIIPIFILIYIVFKPAAREMRRLDVLTRSPWFSHITTAITGINTVRAYHQTNNFAEKFCTLLDRNGVPCYLFSCVNRWLAVRLDLLTISTCVITSAFVITSQGAISPAFAGLALSSAFLMSGMLQFTVRCLIETEARFVCTDRIRYYIDHTPQEKSDVSVYPPPTWPQFGTIEFQNVNLQYRDGLPLALKNLSFKINQGEKIGVVGRTGSGKSSLTVALFRLVELTGGTIKLDDIDISKISLFNLRSKLSIIPQDPVLFSGSIRYNLDPFSKSSDEDIWNALEQAHLKRKLSKLPGQLEAVVSENGSNFSVGERQLMCLARALLRKSTILILDEATAAVDNDTEKLVYQMIDEFFSECTLITIAHRVSSVLSCSRVMVLDAGEVVEFDFPNKLMGDSNSKFFHMVSAFQS